MMMLRSDWPSRRVVICFLVAIVDHEHGRQAILRRMHDNRHVHTAACFLQALQSLGKGVVDDGRVLDRLLPTHGR